MNVHCLNIIKYLLWRKVVKIKTIMKNTNVVKWNNISTQKIKFFRLNIFTYGPCKIFLSLMLSQCSSDFEYCAVTNVTMTIHTVNLIIMVSPSHWSRTIAMCVCNDITLYPHWSTTRTILDILPTEIFSGNNTVAARPNTHGPP